MGYPNLKAEIARSNVGIKDIMEVTGKSRPGVSNNLNGRGKFSVDEAILIRNKLFPRLTIDYLFSSEAKEESDGISGKGTAQNADD